MNNSHQGVVALIPARGGSKGLPGKNVRIFNGLPLIAWTIRAAQACGRIDRLVVSTDDEEIASISRRFGADIEMRPPELASDTASSADVIRHHLARWSRSNLSPDILLLLQPTSPLRAPKHIVEALNQFEAGGLDSLASCTPAPSHPFLAWQMKNGKTLDPFIPAAGGFRRQDFPPAYVLNGAIYVFRAGAFPANGDSVLFGAVGGYVMDASVSIDIDDLDDFLAAEANAAAQVSEDNLTPASDATSKTADIT